MEKFISISSVQSLSRVQLFETPWITARQSSLSITNSRSSLKLMYVELVMPSSHLILCHPLLFLPPIPPSIRVFSNESTLCMRWPEYWSFSFSISPSNEHSGLISSGMDWLDLLAVQGTLKSFLQHHGSKASILQHSAFFLVQLSHPYMTTGKTIALTRRTFVGKVISLLFNMLSRLVVTFLPRSKHLLISWLQSPSAVILEPQKIKSDTVSTVSPSISHKVVGPDVTILVFWMLSFKSTFSLSSLLSSRGFLVPLHFYFLFTFCRASLVAQMVKHLPAMRETQVWFLGREDPLEKEMAIHSSTLAWKIPWMEEPDRLQSMGSQRVRHNWATSLSLSAIRVVSSAYLRLLIFLPAILIPACASSSPAFLMMYSA